MSELLGYAEDAVRKAMGIGVDEAEAVVANIVERFAQLQNNAVKQVYSSIDTGLGIRVVTGRRVGFAYTNKLDPDSIAKAVERAVRAAKGSRPDPHWSRLPEGPQSYPSVEGVYSPSLAGVELPRIVEIAGSLLDRVTEDRRVVVVWGGASVSLWRVAIANSRGIEAEDQGTVAMVGAEAVAREGTDVTPGVFEEEVSRTSIPDPEALAERLREKAIDALRPVKISSGSMPVILTHYALEELFAYTFNQAIRGDNVVRGRSPYAGRIGEAIASEALSVVDDGVMPGGVATSRFDGEGVAKRRTVIVDRGVLRGFVFDSYWGARAGTGSTGNAARRGYSSTPGVSPSNLVISTGDFSEEELVADTRRGLLVDSLQGAHSSNPETGEFSVVAAPAWLVERGELRAVRGVMLAGSAYELLKRISGISKKRRQVGTLVTPWIRFENVRVVSRS